jgi:hypothetical protein
VLGIDYALVIVNRHRVNLMAGMSAGDPCGRVVVFAGMIVAPRCSA